MDEQMTLLIMTPNRKTTFEICFRILFVKHLDYMIYLYFARFSSRDSTFNLLEFHSNRMRLGWNRAKLRLPRACQLQVSTSEFGIILKISEKR